jgi:hypothetical protein
MGADRNERFSSATPDVVAIVSIASHNFNASAPRGTREMTGPKKLASFC